MSNREYYAVYESLCAVRGRAVEHRCHERADEWAYNGLDPDEKIDSRSGCALGKPEFYFPLCKSCHNFVDRGRYCKQGHEFSEENTYLYRGHRYCKTCRVATNQRLRRAAAAAG